MLKKVALCILALTCSALTQLHAAASKDARVTQIIRDVKLLPSEAEARAAAINDLVAEDTSVRTGDQSRSELTFADLTISRLGANTIYSYNRGGKSVDLGGGSVLLRVPKNSGGGSIRASAVSVAVTGTTVILESARGGRSKLLVLEGSARLALVKYPSQTRNVQAGQMLDVPAGATTLPMPTNIDLKRTLKEHPLLAGFPPLPSQPLILAAAERQPPPDEPVYQGQPVGGGPPLVVGPGIPGIGFPPFGGTTGGSNNPRNPRNPRNPGNSNNPGNTQGDPTTGNPGGNRGGVGKGGQQGGPVGVKQPPRTKKPPKGGSNPNVG
jgi:hypothetical protein